MSAGSISALDRLAVLCALEVERRQPRAYTIDQLPLISPLSSDEIPLFRANSVPGYAGQAYKAPLSAIQGILVGVPPANQLTQIRWFSVQDSPFNAVGDGVTDDTAAINACFTAAGLVGGTVRIPYTQKGYKISGQINWPSQVHIEADGAELVQTNPTADVLVLSSGFNDVRCDGLNINYVPNSTGGRAYVIPTGNYCRISNGNIGNPWNVFAVTGAVLALTIEDVNSTSPLAAPYGMSITGNATEIHVARWNAGQSMTSAIGVGLYIANGTGMTFLDCDFTTWAYGCVIDASLVYTNPVPNPNGVNNIFFIGTSFDGCNINALRIAPAANNPYSNVSRISFVGCWTSGSFSNSNVLITTDFAQNVVDGIQFIGHKCYNGGIHGFDIEGGPGTLRNISVGGGSHIGGNSQRVPGAYGGFNVNLSAGGTASGISLCNSRSGNSVGFNGGGSANTQGYGAIMNAPSGSVIAGSASVLIKNNDLTDNVVGGLQNVATNSACVTRGNEGYNPLGAITPPAVPATTVVYTNPYGLDFTVYITALNSLTGIQIGGTSVGLVAAIGYRLPAGQTITLTYAGTAPTWTWFAD